MSLGPSATQSPIELDGLDRGAAEGHVYALKEIDRARSADAPLVFPGSPPVPADFAYVLFVVGESLPSTRSRPPPPPMRGLARRCCAIRASQSGLGTASSS